MYTDFRVPLRVAVNWPAIRREVTLCNACDGTGWCSLSRLLSISCRGPGPCGRPLRVATFCCDVTPPVGQPMFSCDALSNVEQPLLAKGIVHRIRTASDTCSAPSITASCAIVRTMGGGSKIAAAAGADVAHVAVQCIHQHAAPLVDRDAQKLLAEAGLASAHVDPKALDEIETAIGGGRETRSGAFRAIRPDRHRPGQGRAAWPPAAGRWTQPGNIPVRLSFCQDAAVRALPEGTIDPYLKTITLARGAKPLVRLHYYATHPQSSYGDHRASSDFPGHAREALQRKEGVFQIYFTGCGGDITVGKYNDSSKECRASWPHGCWPAWRLRWPRPSSLRRARSVGEPIRSRCRGGSIRAIAWPTAWPA